MSKESTLKGRSFERRVEHLLLQAQQGCPARMAVQRQKVVDLRDGRSKILDFELRYQTMASTHIIAVECQHRASWSSEIIDKILSVRNHSLHNRFWFIYEADGFLSADVKAMFDSHGVMHFSISELEHPIQWVVQDVLAAEQRCKDIAAQNATNPTQGVDRYDLRGTPSRTSDPAMRSGR